MWGITNHAPVRFSIGSAPPIRAYATQRRGRDVDYQHPRNVGSQKPWAAVAPSRIHKDGGLSMPGAYHLH